MLENPMKYKTIIFKLWHLIASIDGFWRSLKSELQEGSEKLGFLKLFKHVIMKVSFQNQGYIREVIEGGDHFKGDRWGKITLTGPI